MAWYFASYRVAVERDSEDYPDIKLGFVDILDTDTTNIHSIGTGSYRRDLTFVIFSGYAGLAPALVSGYWGLTSDQGVEGTYQVLSYNAQRLQALNYDTDVYRVTVKLERS
jgi:hypothetical protein